MADCLSLCFVGSGEWTQIIRFAASTYPPRRLPHFSPLILTETGLCSEHHFKTCLIHREGASHKCRQCTPREMSAFFLRNEDRSRPILMGQTLMVSEWMDVPTVVRKGLVTKPSPKEDYFPQLPNRYPKQLDNMWFPFPWKKETLLSHTLLFKYQRTHEPISDLVGSFGF